MRALIKFAVVLGACVACLVYWAGHTIDRIQAEQEQIMQAIEEGAK